MNGDRRRLRARAATALGVVGLSVASCGGSSQGLSRSQLDAQADSICQRGTAAVKAAGAPPANFETNSASASRYLDKIAPISDKAISEMSALKPSESVKQEWSRLLAFTQGTATALDEARTKAHRRNPAALEDFSLATGPLMTQKINAAARRVGAVGCANE